MKELYSFEIKREVVQEQPYKRKTKKGEVDAVRKTKKKVSNKIILNKPSVADIEKAEFFFGQKYNEYINAGFLTKTMLYNKMGKDEETPVSKEVTDAFLNNLESARIIEFYENAENLTEEQKKKLEQAKEDFVETRIVIQNYESQVQGQFSQTAEVKAEEKMIEWFIFNFTYYEDELNGEKNIFPLFSGSNYKEKRETYLELCEDKESIEDDNIIAIKDIFDESFTTIARVVNIWYNKLGKNQEEIEKALKDIFEPNA